MRALEVCLRLPRRRDVGGGGSEGACGGAGLAATGRRGGWAGLDGVGDVGEGLAAVGAAAGAGGQAQLHGAALARPGGCFVDVRLRLQSLVGFCDPTRSELKACSSPLRDECMHTIMHAESRSGIESHGGETPF